MTLRAKIILIVIIALSAIIVAFGVVKLISFLSGVGQPSVSDEPKGDQPSLPPYNPNFEDQDAPESKKEQPKPVVNTSQNPTEASISAFVRPFAERFGTYSNQSNFKNLKDLMPSMTERMRAWAQERVTVEEKAPFQSVYKGTTTRALAVKIESLDEAGGLATVRVSTQRKESGEGDDPRTYIQDVVLRLVKQNGEWLVDSAEWQ